MFVKKNLALASLCLSVLVSGVDAQTRNLFVMPSGGGNSLPAYSGDSLSPLANTGVAPAPFLVLPNGSGTKYYVISKSAADTVVVVDGGNLSTLVSGRFNFGTAAESAAITPDGKKLLVLAGTLHIIDTATDTDISGAGLSVGSTPNDVAISHDSTRAFVLSKASTVATAVDLTTNTLPGLTFPVPGINSTLSVGPNGFVYITAQNRFYELNPKTMQISNELPLNAVPGRPVFTPDGKYAMFVNQLPVTGSSLILVDLSLHKIAASLPQISGVTFDKLLVGSNSLVYATQAGGGKLYTLTVPGLAGNEASFANGPLSGVLTAAVSNEIQPRALFAASSNVLYRVDLSPGGNQVVQQTGVAVAPIDLDFVSSAVTGNASQVLLYNNGQSVPVSTAFTPLVVRVVDSSGRPLANVPVNFASSDGGAVLSSPNTTTSNDGYAQTNLTASATAGQITVTVTAGAAIGSYALTSTGTTAGGGTGGTGGTGGAGDTGTAPIAIISGNGQLVREQFQAQDLLGVIVRDSSGKPVPGATVTFAVATGGGLGGLQIISGTGAALGICTSAGQTAICSTDADGKAGVGFVASSTNTLSFASTTISATANGSAVNFVETTYLTFFQGAFAPDPTVIDVAPASGESRSFIVQAGQPLAGAIKVNVLATAGPSTGLGIPNVGMSVSTGLDPKEGPTATCAGVPAGIPLSDGTGLITCDLVAGGKTGTVPLFITVAGLNNRANGTLTVTPGPPGALALIQGNNQSGVAGQRLPLALVAQVTDAFGNVLPGVVTTFEVVNPGTLTLSNVFNTSDANGKVSALVTLGGTPGPQQVRVKVGSVTSTFTATVNVTFGGIAQVSGGGQTAVVNQAFAQPLVAKVTSSNGNPIANVDVAFAVAGGSATLSAASAKTDASGNASITVTAGSSPGPISVSATVGTFNTSFALTSRLPGPSLTISSFRNGASFAPGIVPGGIVTIFGPGIAPSVQGVVTPTTSPVGQLPITLAGVDVSFNGVQAPIFSVANVAGTEQVTVQVPFETVPGQASVTVRVSGGSTTINNVPISAVQPGIFETTDPNGRKIGVVTRPDGSFVSPANPARKGETVQVYLTGLGNVSPAAATNRAGIPGQAVLAPMIVGVNNAGIPYISAQCAPGMIGVYTITFVVPSDAPSGSTIPLSFAATGPDGVNVYSNTSSLAIQ